MIFRLPFLTLLIAFVSSQWMCAEDEFRPDDESKKKNLAFFENQVRPLLSQNCFSCHGSKMQKGNLRLDSRQAMLDGGDSGSVLAPGRPEESLLAKVLVREDDAMPPGKRLSPEEIQVVRKWIAIGSPWPENLSTRNGPGFSQSDKNYWAFQPVASVVPQRKKEDRWSTNEIDFLVWPHFAANGLTPGRVAAKISLMRRAYFDLVGLPPTPREQREFLEDDQPKAFERLVNRLLEDSRYGEKWARHWLDLVRYAESDGYKQDDYRPNAWRYRDYVIDSFNQDKPYDRFVLEQLAGDEIDPENPENLVATGFLRHWIYEYNQRDVRTQWDTILNDITNVTGDVFLALGMNCARCHDHKFDPILQVDYFRLRAFFAPLSPRDDIPLASRQQREDYRVSHEKWSAATQQIRKQIEELELPFHQEKMNPEIEKFPLDIRPMMRKEAVARSPFEQQLSNLAFRQVKRLTIKEMEKKITGEKRVQWDQLRQELARFDSIKPSKLPVALSVTDVSHQAPPTVIPGKGVGKTIEPGLLSIINPANTKVESIDNGRIQSTGRRLALAKWIVSPGNPLTSRVIVNRIWQYHFGRGIVESASDFGKLGQPPADLELLDFLASTLVRNGWKFKSLHRKILLSSTYRQAASKTPHPRLRPFQQLVRRLEAEQIRDSMLAVSGELDLKPGGPSSEDTGNRRTIYNRVIRNQRDPLLDVF
ncbi:MAG: PSD1 and planctomycete cytochrome C domain-containing protein, partial [Planctomycetota bacterium]|nr:PSD1 and planctomycete cytochrome C domain-containing protein [Planctomycetota bacterium]